MPYYSPRVLWEGAPLINIGNYKGVGRHEGPQQDYCDGVGVHEERVPVHVNRGWACSV